MSLDDLQHVEAVALVRALEMKCVDPKLAHTARCWLEDVHPSPVVYMAAMKASGSDGS